MLLIQVSHLIDRLMFEADIQVLFCIQRFQAINAKYTYPYCIAVKVSMLDRNGQLIQALPHSIVSASEQDCGGTIDSKINCYLTPYMKIQPNNFTVNVKQICSFKLNVEWKKDTNENQLLVETFLYVLTNSMTFTHVGTQLFKLKKLTGRSTYLPIFFEGFQYTCFADASIHTQLIGLKWKRSQQLKQEGEASEMQAVENSNYHTFAQYIAGKTAMSLPLLTDISQKYTKLLLSSIDKLKNSISKLQQQTVKFQIPELDPLKTNDPNIWATSFLNNLNQLSGYCHQLWNQYIRIRITFPDMRLLKQTFEEQLKYQYKRHIYQSLSEQTKSQKMLERNINNEIIIVGDLKLPRSVKVFVERGDERPTSDIKNNSFNSSQYLSEIRTQHVVILVHGLSANRMAMQALKNIILYYFPHMKVITSLANEYRTEQHIEEMGKRLSEEIRFIISSRKLTNYKLSFISHSLGGLITRAALLHLQSFKDHFDTLVTLGTPHLGYLFHHSYLVKMGIWFLNRWKQSLSLSMLSFNDKQNLNQSYLYRLSMQPGFDWFKHVVLISNPKDSYVSQHSALIQNCQQAINDKNSQGERGKLYHEIMDNLTQRLNKTKTTRITVHGLLSTKTGMDNIIGRTAHIEYLSDTTFLKMFVLSHQNLFSK